MGIQGDGEIVVRGSILEIPFEGYNHKIKFMNPRVLALTYKSPFKWILTFFNNEIKQFDLVPFLLYSIYSSLKVELFCKKVATFNGTVIWNDFIDFDPDTLYLES